MAKRFLLLFTLAISLSTVFATDLPRHESELLNFSANPFLSSQGIPSPALPELEFTGFEREFGYYIVQFNVPLDNSVREKVIAIAKETPLGAESFGYIPDNAIVYRLSKKYLDEIRALPEVRWVGPLEPQFRVRHILFDENPRPDEDGRVRVNVKLFSGEDTQDLIVKLGEIELEVVESGSARLHEFVLFSLEPQSVRKFAIIVANHEATQWAERRMPKYPNNDWSRWINQSYSTSGMGSVGSGWYAQMTADATKTPIHIRGIYGEGQLVGSSDTGVDTTSIYFCDPGVAVPKINFGTSTNWTTTVPDYGHRKIRAYSRHTVSGNSTDYADEDDGHGSHVNGSIGGNNEAHNPPNTTFDAGDGMAPLCRLTFSDLSNPSGSLIVPSNLSNTILKFAYNHGARLHTNSWGSRYSRPNHGTHPYNDESADVDEFTWFNKDFLIFFSAGNSNTDQGYWYPPDGINGEGLGKNIVTVGAAESGSGSGNSSWTNPGSTSDNNPEDNASFSSHGPSSEGMMKPNLTACGGWYIFSARGLASGSMCHTGMTNMGGTSMSSPTTAGLAALVREYYEDGFYPTGAAVSGDGFNPSAALVKATLQASCRNMTGAYTIDAFGNSGHQDVPSNGQGWGRVTLDDALYFDDTHGTDTRNLEVHDISPGFSSTGSHHYVVSCGPSTSESFKVVLSYSDYPSTPGAYSVVNNLNLEVQVNSSSYKGNVFASSGARSVTGGSYDNLNVDEVVWLNGSTVASQQVDIYVHCTSVPQGPQPYALVILGDLSPNEPNLVYYDHEIDDGAGDGDGYAEKGETINMPIWLENLTGSAPATTVTANVTESDPYISFTDNSLTWPDIAPGANQRSNTDHCTFVVADDDATCGHVATITINWSADGGTYTGSDDFDITLGCPAPILEYDSHVIDDNAGGDNDGYPEPGESIILPVTLNHIGGANAQDVSATLSTSDPYITITDGNAVWPDIAVSGSEQSLADHFGFDVLPTCPDGREVTFTLDWECYCGSGSENIVVTMGGPKPKLVYVAPAGIDDGAGGDGDGYPEPGETIVMSIDLRNDGTENATTISGRITESDPYITLTDNAATWPNILVSATLTSNADHFAFTVGAGTPCGHVVEFTLIDTCNGDRVDTNTISVTIQSPDADLSEGGITIDDVAGGDGDGIAEAGETFRMAITLDNNIASNAHGISGTISTGDAYITIIDNTSDWPDIPGSGSSSSLSPHFTIEADPLTPYLHDATINLNWTAWCGSGSEVFTLTIGDPADNAPSAPALYRPFPFERIGDGAGSTEPYLSWLVPSDTDGDALYFETRFGTNSTMTGATAIEGVSDGTGFSPAPPVAEGSGTSNYHVNSQGEGALSNGTTYWWDARAHDGNRWGGYSSNRSFTIDTGRSQPDWHQTTNAQFQTGTIDNLTVDSDRVISGLGENIIFEDDFEGYSSQAEFEAEWTVVGSNVYWSTDAYVSPSHCVRVTDNSTSTPYYFYHTFGPLDNGFMSVWSACLNTSDEGEIMRFYDSSANRKGQVYYRGGWVAYWDGTSRTNLQEIDPATWLNFRVDFDRSADEIYVTIDETSVYGPFSYQDGATELYYILCGPRVDGYTGSLFFDDVLIGQEGGASDGEIISQPIVLDWNSGYTAWDMATWTQGTDDSVVIVCDYRDSGVWTPFDSTTTTGTTGTLDLSGLGAEDTIRLRGKLVTSGGNQAELFDWSVSWASGMLGVEVLKGGPSGPLYSTTTWDIGQLEEGAVVVMNTGESAFIKNTGTVPIDIRLKAETPNWTLANSAGADAVLLMGLFDLDTAPPAIGDFTSPADVLTEIFKLSGSTNSEPFASDASNGINIAIDSGRYLYLHFGAPSSNTYPAQQTITVTVEAQSSM